MRGRPGSRASKYIPKLEYPRRIYEGGTPIPQPHINTRKQELLDKFRQKFEHRESQPERSVPERFTDFDLGYIPTNGENNLPVAEFKQDIIKAVAENQVTIITAETGAGKSTQIPQYLLEAGYRVNMTQPRRLSANFLTEEIGRQVEEVIGDDARGLVGVHTAEINSTTEKTKITVLTDGLRLAQEFGEREELEHEVLIIDEVHEWNSNIEMLVAQSKRLMKDKPGLRLVIMSATMESEKLAKYFADGVKRKLPPIIDIPGRNHEVTRIDEPDSTVVEQAVKYAKKDENILLFLPGVGEIEDTAGAILKKLEDQGVKDATVLKLHSKMSIKEQDAVKSSYPGPKIICATNIAQTSITIPDVNVVIDAGLERRTEIDEENVQSLNLRLASRADMDQRAGRTGRVAPGLYINTRLNADEDYVAYDSLDRLDYPIPEILRTDLDRNILLAASAGIDFAELDLFHAVSKSTIERSKHSLKMLEAIDENGLITAKGVRMVKLPVRPMLARMMVEAEDLGYSTNIRANLAASIASIEVGGLQSWLRDASKDWRNLSDEKQSDVILQSDLLIMSKDISILEQNKLGLDVRNVERARELYGKICKRSGISAKQGPLIPTAEERKQITRAIAAGMIDFIYQRNGVSEYRRLLGKTGLLRTLGDRTVVKGKPQYVAGVPFRIERYKKGSKQEEHIIQEVTVVPKDILAEIGSSALRSWRDIGLQWRGNRLKRVQEQLFRSTIPTGLLRETDAVPDDESLTEVRRYILERSGPALKSLKRTKSAIEKLQHLTEKQLPVITHDYLLNLIDLAIDNRNLDPDYIDWLIGGLIEEKGLNLDDLISESERQEIIDNAPSSIEHNGVLISLIYRNGKVFHEVKNIKDAKNIQNEIYLPDGRQVLMRYKKRDFTVEKLHKHIKE